MKKVLIIATVGSFLGFERNDIKILQSLGYEVHCAANFKLSELDNFQADGIVRHQIDFVRSPYSLSNVETYKELKKLFAETRFDLVHCHTPMGGILGRLAAKKYRKAGTKVFYTAHGFHFFKGAPLINWLLYFPVEWIWAHWTDVLITINKEDYTRAKKRMHARKVEYIPGVGIDIDKITTLPVEKEEMRQRLGISENEYMILSVGELSKRKNVSAVIEALYRMKDNRIKYFICGTGPEEKNLKELITKFHLEEQVKLLGFRTDITDLLRAADLFVFPSLQEGLPVALMEAIAAKTPVICSNIRGNTDLIIEEEFLFNPQDKQSLADCLENVMDTDMSAAVERHYELLEKYGSKNVSEKMKVNYSTGIQMSQDPSGGGMAFYERQTILQELGIDESRHILLSVGELSDRKNQETVIKAIGQLQRSDILYLLAGEGNLKNQFEELIQKYGLEKQVFMLGQRMDIGKLCDFADIFVHISVREGLGMAPLEAMAKGMPLVSSYVNGMKDYTLDGVTGYCIKNPKEVKEVSMAIERMVDNYEYIAKYGKINKAISEIYSMKNSELFMKEIYQNNTTIGERNYEIFN